MKMIAAVVVAMLLIATSRAWAADSCAYDHAAMLALDEEAFDQDLANGGGGWRALAGKPGCELAAADLLAAYRAKHAAASPVLAWHEGQMRATAGQYDRAIPLLELDRKPVGQDVAGWNYYVDATVAFLRRNMAALLKAHEQLAAVPYAKASGLPPLKNGYFELPSAPGQPVTRMRWPPNIEVVEGLIACFNEPYSQAYDLVCRPHAP
jgi:hypothetical protein